MRPLLFATSSGVIIQGPGERGGWAELPLVPCRLLRDLGLCTFAPLTPLIRRDHDTPRSPCRAPNSIHFTHHGIRSIAPSCCSSRLR